MQMAQVLERFKVTLCLYVRENIKYLNSSIVRSCFNISVKVSQGLSTVS